MIGASALVYGNKMENMGKSTKMRYNMVTSPISLDLYPGKLVP